MKVTTHKNLRDKVYRAVGNNMVIHHQPTAENPLGQSGIHTFVDDIIQIVLNSKDEADAWKQLHRYLTPEGE